MTAGALVSMCGPGRANTGAAPAREKISKLRGPTVDMADGGQGRLAADTVRHPRGLPHRAGQAASSL